MCRTVDNAQLRNEEMTMTLRPAVLPDDKRLFSYPVIVGLGVSAVGVFLANMIMIVLPLIVLAVFPGLPVLFHLIYHLFVKIEVLPDKVIVTDYVSDPIVRFSRRQEITFSEISYIYYLGKEINLLSNLRNRLRKFKIPVKETDYTKAHLMDRYGIPEEVYAKFEESSQKTLTDSAATGILMMLDEIYRKYDVTRETRDSIKKALEDDSNFSFEYLKAALRDHPVSAEDLEDLRDEFANINADVLAPFLLTKVNLSKYQKVSKQRNGAHLTARTDNGLVLSNENGTNKVYLMRFHDLSRADLHEFISTVNSRRPGISYLMTKKEHKHLLGNRMG